MGLRIGVSGLGRRGVNWLVALAGMGGIAGLAVRLAANCSPMQPGQARNDNLKSYTHIKSLLQLPNFQNFY